MRTAGRAWPKISTLATPSIVEIERTTIVSTYSSTVRKRQRGRSGRDLQHRGFSRIDLSHVGGVGMLGGSWRVEAEIADCTSSAAPSMFRSSRNCSVIWVEPSTLTEFIVSRPGISENCVSNGVATAEPMVEASAPGRFAFTTMVGKVDIGQLVDRQREIAEQPREKQGCHDQNGHDRTPDEDFGKIHGALRKGLLNRMFIGTNLSPHGMNCCSTLYQAILPAQLCNFRSLIPLRSWELVRTAC